MSAAGGRKLLSIVTPCFNEEANVADHFARVTKALEPYAGRYDFEHIYTDNCSTDGTFAELTKLAAGRSGVRAVRFSRNVGANRAIYQGLIRARGDAAILIQADLQDPPELIPEFIAGWEAGYDVVFGQIQKRREGFLLRSVRRAYYKAIAALADVRPPENAGEFRLTSRRVLDAIRCYREDDIYLRGVIAHIGFRQKAVPYVRAPREKGKTSTNLVFLAGYALNGLVSTSIVPIRVVTMAGFVVAAGGMLFGLYTTVAKLLDPDAVPHGITTLAALITFLSGMQLFALGIIGEYIRKIYAQTLGRPQAFVAEQIGFPPETPEGKSG